MLLNHKLSDLDWNGRRGKQMERRELTGSFKHATFWRHERQPEMTFFSFLTRLRTTTFILLRMFSKYYCPGMRNVHFRFPSVTQKRRLLKLSIVLKVLPRAIFHPF